MPTPFTLRFGEGDRHISVDGLKQGLENALEMLRNIGEDITPSGVQIRWEVVGASMRSPLTLKFAPRTQDRALRSVGKRIINACVAGIAQLEKKAVLPAHFNEDALEAAQNLFRVGQKDAGKVSIGAGGSQVTPTEQTIEHIKEVIQRVRIYSDPGTVEGKLEIVSVHDHDSFFIFEALTKYKIECLLAEPEQLEEAKSLLKKRVSVRGLITYRNHRPSKVRVEAIRVLRDSDLPQPSDIGPIDITEGLSSEDHVRRIRDAR